jgi:hypothetical protein
MRGLKGNLLLSILAWVGLSLPAGVLAAHFTFNVPVELHELDEKVRSVIVSCVAYDAQRTVIGQGMKSLTIPRATGEYVGTVNIPFDAQPQKSAYDARTYRCFLGLMWVSGANPPKQMPGPSNPNPEFQPQPGTPFVNSVTGTIPGTVQLQVPKQRFAPGFIRR